MNNLKLKSIKLYRIEQLPFFIAKELAKKGHKYVVIETREEEKIIPLKEDGIRGYFLSLGKFKDVEIMVDKDGE